MLLRISWVLSGCAEGVGFRGVVVSTSGQLFLMIVLRVPRVPASVMILMFFREWYLILSLGGGHGYGFREWMG